MNFLAPFKFYKDEPRALVIEAIFQPRGDKLLADCRLIGRRALPGHTEPQEITHFTARILVSKQAPETVTVAAPSLSAENIVNAAQIYRVYFHGPAYQVLERAWWDGATMIGEMAAQLPKNHQPSERPTVVAPRLIELCFQTAGLWEMGAQHHMGLPRHLGHVACSRTSQSVEGRLYALVTPHPEQGTFDARVIDAAGNQCLRLDDYSTVALPDALDAETLKALQDVLSPQAVTVS